MSELELLRRQMGDIVRTNAALVTVAFLQSIVIAVLVGICVL